MTRLDEIEEAVKNYGPDDLLASEVLALVAVARAAITITGLRGYEDKEPYAIALRAALAPLLESTAPRQRAAHE